MTGNPEVINRLNQGLRDELTAINQYFVHAEMCHNWGYHRLGGHIRKQSIDEMRHAEAFIERILFLDATPTMEPMPLNIGQSVRQQLERDLGLEHGAVRTYNESIRVCRDAGDNTSRELFERLLKDEEGHVDWLESQLPDQRDGIRAVLEPAARRNRGVAGRGQRRRRSAKTTISSSAPMISHLVVPSPSHDSMT